MRGLNITGEVLIFKNDYGYSLALSHKKQDETWEKMYITAQLPKEHELENKTAIIINKGFLSFYNDKNGLPKLKAVIQEYMVIGQEPTNDLGLPF